MVNPSLLNLKNGKTQKMNRFYTVRNPTGLKFIPSEPSLEYLDIYHMDLTDWIWI